MEIILFFICSLLYGIIVILFGIIFCILFYFLAKIPVVVDRFFQDIEGQLVGRK